jgi:ribosomal protein S18 acetylase RimI-like enzyme
VIHTSIEPENQAALKLYRGLGFEETGETAWDEVVLALAPSRNPAIRKEGAEA